MRSTKGGTHQLLTTARQLTDHQGTIEIKSSQREVKSVLFTGDGKRVFSGGDEGVIRQWRVEDGKEVGEPLRAIGEIYAAALSSDGKWLVCGLRPSPNRGSRNVYVRVWDTRTHEKVFDIKDHNDTVFAVDISPDSTKLVTGSHDKTACIWSIATGEQLVGPLKHDGIVVAVRFSPNGDRIATATAAANPDNPKTAKSIRIYNSRNGQLLVLFDTPFRACRFMTSLAWTADGHQLFAASYSHVKYFDTSSGSLLKTWPVPGGAQSSSVVLSRNQKFIVVSAYTSLSFWDSSTRRKIGTVIKHASDIWWIALSPNDDRVATGEENGKVTLRNLHGILPASYLTVNVSDQLGGLVEFDTSQLPLMYIGDTVFESWTQGDLTRAEQFLTKDVTHPSNPFHHAHTLAQRSLVNTRLQRPGMATDDAKKVSVSHLSSLILLIIISQSIEIQRSNIGLIASAIARLGSGEYDAAIDAFDLVFKDALPSDNSFLCLIKVCISCLCFC